MSPQPGAGRRAREQVSKEKLMRRFLNSLVAAAVVAALALAVVAQADDQKDKPDLDKIPKKVMDALKARFPKAEIHKWTKEKEGDKDVYDIEFKQGARKFEADI